MLSKLRQKDSEGTNKQGPKMVSFGASKLEGAELAPEEPPSPGSTPAPCQK